LKQIVEKNLLAQGPQQLIVWCDAFQ
jgi:hypothetical protein